jgi:hypothetical protein
VPLPPPRQVSDLANSDTCPRPTTQAEDESEDEDAVPSFSEAFHRKPEECSRAKPGFVAGSIKSYAIQVRKPPAPPRQEGATTVPWDDN